MKKIRMDFPAINYKANMALEKKSSEGTLPPNEEGIIIEHEGKKYKVKYWCSGKCWLILGSNFEVVEE